MKLVVLTVVLIFNTSWQQNSLESLDDTLEKLIRQTEPVEQIDSSEGNHSRILYLMNPVDKKSDNHRRKENDDSYGKTSRSSSIQTDIDNHVSVADLLDAIGLRPSKIGQNVDKDQVLKDITRTVEQGAKLNSKFDIDDLKELLERPTFMGKKSTKENIPEEDIIRRASETENDLFNKYPEIIIDKITYPNKSETTNVTKIFTVVTEEKEEGQENGGFDRNIPMELAKELKSLLSEVKKMKTADTNDGYGKQLHLTQHFHGPSHLPTHGSQQQFTHGSPQQPTHGSPQQPTHGSPQQPTHGSPQQPTHGSPQQPTHGSPQQPTHGSLQQPTHGSPCGNVHRPYGSPCPHYQDSPSFDRSSGPQNGDTMHANTWEAHNTRQEMLMRISREQKLNRIRFITDLINNMMSRFVYRPLYGKK